MVAAKFPLRDQDGGFCVDIRISISAGDAVLLSKQVRKWILKEWLPANKTWTRHWRPGGDEVLHYEDEFNGPPEVSAGHGTEICVTLHGRKSARLWRDWFVSRMLPDLKARFSQIGKTLSVENAAQHERTN
jgi:hypothetical protein